MVTIRFSSLLIVLFLCSCTSPGVGDAVGELTHTGEDCICGTPDGDFLGCHCEDCLLNGGNPFNPECTCLPLRPVSELEMTFASFDPSGGASRPTIGGNLVGLDVIKLAGKSKRLRGEVIEDDGESIRFKDQGGRVATYTYDELDQRFAYLLLKGKTNKEDGQAELRLANFANEVGLYAHARRHYGYALAADSALEAEVEHGLARLRAKAAASEMNLATEALNAGDEKGAREHLLNIVREFPDEPAAHEALTRLNALNVERFGPKEAALLEQSGPEAWVEVEPVSKFYESAAEKNQKALSSGNRSTFRSALSDCKRARKELSKARRAAVASELVESYERLVTDLEVEINMNMASVDLAAGNYSKALSSVNEALALDPNDEKAQQQRARIESARNSYKEGYDKGYQRGSNDQGTWAYAYRPGAGYIYRRGYGIRGHYGGWRVGGGLRTIGGLR